MKRTGDDVDEFVAAIAPAARRRDAVTMLTLLRDSTGHEPEMWGTIIGFGACHYRYPTGTEGDSPIIGFAPRKQATTVYLLDGIDRHRETLRALGPHTTGAGCLYLKDVEAVDRAILREVLSSSYRAITAEPTDYAEISVID